jgi:hypothetical protein
MRMRMRMIETGYPPVFAKLFGEWSELCYAPKTNYLAK